MGALTDDTDRTLRDPERQARQLDVAEVPDEELEARHAAVSKRLAEACARAGFGPDALREVLQALGIVPDGQGTRTGEWGTRLGPATKPPGATEDTAPVPPPPPAPETPAAATTAPETLIPDGLTVWQIPDRVAHWANACPDRRGQTACSGVRLADTIARPVSAHTVPKNQRCTSAACGARWRRWAAGQPMRFKCPRCRTNHDHGETR